MRFGKKRDPHYRIIVTEARSPRQGWYTDQVGTYYPMTNPATVNLDKDKVKEWMSKGAQPTETVYDILAKAGVLTPKKQGEKTTQKKSDKKKKR